MQRRTLPINRQGSQQLLVELHDALALLETPRIVNLRGEQGERGFCLNRSLSTEGVERLGEDAGEQRCS